MNTGGPLGRLKTSVSETLPLSTLELAPLPPALVERRETPIASGPPRRTKIWELSTHLHCSVIGTCLSTGELRQVLRKLGVTLPECSDHDLHTIGVELAGRHDKAAKLLHKALDERHRLSIVSSPRRLPKRLYDRSGVRLCDAATSLGRIGRR